MVRFSEGDDLTVNEEELPFTLLDNLGHGHSGIVEKVQDKHTGKVYARKKIIIRGQRVKAEKEKIFWNEVKIIRSFEKHHHIIRVFATYMAKREVGLLLEPVADEGDLARFLDYVSEMPYGQRHNILPILYRAFGCLAAGLGFIHRRHIRHKDIKPQNILVHNNSVIYTDFGYSLDYATFSQSTTDGQPDALTRRYSAPEVLAKEKRNKSSDVFSLGCVYLEIVAAVGTGVGEIVPQEKSFSEEMSNIHNNLQNHWLLPSHLDELRQMIILMTARDRCERSTADSIFGQLRDIEGASCKECQESVSEGKVSYKSQLASSVNSLGTSKSKVLPNHQSWSNSISTIPLTPSKTRIPRNFYDPSSSLEGYADWNHDHQRYLSVAWSYMNSRHYREHYVQGVGWTFYD
ncbi:kinase-like domain-containing protein [Pyrenochaeta sp. MPI-SDFR-AT-0127]|nr:kinase-like domain-containing protein [Pyrenochaeta sp. MPI-SDFR-AT-0127]